MKQILLTNDDGYDAKGLLALRDELKKRFKDLRILIIAPSKQKSACSHSLTLHHPLRLKHLGEDYYCLDDGTPTDCVYIALSKIFNANIDLVVSGINHGANMGEDISYSGTCAAAIEAILHGVDAIACSLYHNKDSMQKNGFELACDLSCQMIEKMLNSPIKLAQKREFINLNIPAVSKDEFKGFRVTYMGKRHYDTKLDVRLDPRGLEYIWLGEPSIQTSSAQDLDSDIGAVFAGYASLSPICLDMCAKSSMDELKKMVLA